MPAARLRSECQNSVLQQKCSSLKKLILNKKKKTRKEGKTQAN
jgi:hypothetical protein